MSITVEVTQDEDFPMVEFGIEFGQFRARVVLDEPYLCSKEQWLKFAHAVPEKEVAMLNFYQGNGQGSMMCDGKTLRCTAQPSGMGGDVTVEVIMPLNAETWEALMLVIEHPLMNECWKRLAADKKQ